MGTREGLYNGIPVQVRCATVIFQWIVDPNAQPFVS